MEWADTSLANWPVPRAASRATAALTGVATDSSRGRHTWPLRRTICT
jgi:hypothetical protein